MQWGYSFTTSYRYVVPFSPGSEYLIRFPGFRSYPFVRYAFKPYLFIGFFHPSWAPFVSAHDVHNAFAPCFVSRYAITGIFQQDLPHSGHLVNSHPFFPIGTFDSNGIHTYPPLSVDCLGHILTFMYDLLYANLN